MILSAIRVHRHHRRRAWIWPYLGNQVGQVVGQTSIVKSVLFLKCQTSETAKSTWQIRQIYWIFQFQFLSTPVKFTYTIYMR